MAISRIRGSQIKNRTIIGENIEIGSLTDEHIAPSAMISEEKLNIDWESKSSNILKAKKIINYIQVNNTDVSELSFINLTDLNIISNEEESTLSISEREGIIVDEPKNIIAVRNADDNEPILFNEEFEVYGKLTHNDVDNKYILSFYYVDESMNETEYTMKVDQKINWKYLKRFNLENIDETFFIRESNNSGSIVDSGTDIITNLNLTQLAKDIYGNSFSLDGDGNPNLTSSIIEQILNESNKITELKNDIENEIQEREQNINDVINDLTSTDENKGASLIGINDKNDKINATTVEDALIELANRISFIDNGTATIAGKSEINGNIKINDTEIVIYTHPEKHPANIIIEDDEHKFITNAEKTKLNNILEDATKVENSNINGNIKINDSEVNVYVHPESHPASMIIEDNNHRFVTDAEKIKLNNVIIEATKTERSNINGNVKINDSEVNVYAHPSNHPASMIVEDSNHRFVTDIEKNNWNNIITNSTIVKKSSINGNININDTEEIVVYKHPENHSANIIIQDENHRFVTDTEKIKWNNIISNTAKVEKSNINGNIKINDVEETIYVHPESHPASMVVEDSNRRFVTDTEKNNWNNKPASAINDIDDAVSKKHNHNNKSILDSTSAVFTATLEEKINNMLSTNLQIEVGNYSTVWNHNFGSVNYTINAIPDQPSINVYYKNKTANSIEIAFYKILGTTIETYASYDKTVPVNIDVMLLPLN